MGVVVSAFGEDEPDLSNDGIVNILDLIKISRMSRFGLKQCLNAWRKTCNLKLTPY